MASAKTELIQIRIAPEEKTAVKELCAKYGLTVSAAVSFILRASIARDELPFVQKV